jgi:RimJ/RimL family protein N-acetyltransferase
MPLIPVTTKRLLLRALNAHDLDAVYALLSDETIMARMSWPQRTREEVQAWLERRIRDEQMHSLSVWAAEDQELHQLIGLCGFSPPTPLSANRLAGCTI